MKFSRLLWVCALLDLAACQPKSSTPVAATDDSPTLATVDGIKISRGFFDAYIKAITGKGSADLTAEQRDQALDNLIRAEVVGEHAVKEGMDKNPDTAALIELTRLNVLQQAVADQVLKANKITDQDLHAEYETQLAHLSKEEFHARHILLATQPFAQKIVARLEKGERFEDLAKKESMDSSKDNGGDLGWFTADKMVKPFAEAVQALKPGQYTHQPVQTQYGWHVIQLVETRPLQPPSYDSVRQRLEQVVQSKKVKANTDEWLRDAKIDKKTENAPASAAGSSSAAPAPRPESNSPAAPASGPAPKPAQ